MASPDQDPKRLGDELYEKYGKPLEAEHRGEYIAISQAGDYVLGQTLDDVLERAENVLGQGSFLFKVGERVVWNFR